MELNDYIIQRLNQETLSTKNQWQILLCQHYCAYLTEPVVSITVQLHISLHMPQMIEYME